MSLFAIAAFRRRSFGGSKGALYWETLQATGFYLGRVVIATAEFAPMLPPFTGLPRRFQSDGHRYAFSEAWRNLSVRCGPNQKPKPNAKPNPGSGPTASRWSAPSPGKERVGRTTLFSSSAMSSGRLFLDRVGRHQSPSPLHRHGQHILIARPEGTNYHRTVSSVLTGCLSFRDRRTVRRSIHFV